MEGYWPVINKAQRTTHLTDLRKHFKLVPRLYS